MGMSIGVVLTDKEVGDEEEEKKTFGSREDHYLKLCSYEGVARFCKFLRCVEKHTAKRFPNYLGGAGRPCKLQKIDSSKLLKEVEDLLKIINEWKNNRSSVPEPCKKDFGYFFARKLEVYDNKTLFEVGLIDNVIYVCKRAIEMGRKVEFE